ncbi:eukaryotic translation initiation factor 2C, 2 [Rhizophlyctis rosea]|nr:eukaryotic translation initiation factor 2C, 2 [Rhizophlyctis rosea]
METATAQETSAPEIVAEPNPESAEPDPFPPRPGVGLKGVPAQVQSNFFPLVLPGRTIYLYDVEVFDGRKIMYTPSLLRLQDDKASLEVEIQQTERPNRPKRQYTMSIQFVKPVNFQPLKDFAESRLTPAPNGPCPPVPQDALMAIDILLRHRPTMLTSVVSTRNAFYKRELGHTDLTGGVEAWNGLKVAARPCAGGLFALADITSSAFMIPGNLLDLAGSALRRLPQAPLSQDQRRILEKVFKSYKVEVVTRGDFRRQYRIKGVTRTTVAQTMFRKNVNGQDVEISVEDHFRQEHNIQLRYPHLPCLIAGAEGKTYVPLEICRMLPNQKVPRKLNPEQTALMIKHAQTRPSDRLNRIRGAAREFLSTPQTASNEYSNPHMAAFNVSISSTPQEVPARILPAPRLLANNQNFTPNDGVWNFKNLQVHQTRVDLTHWSVVSFAPQQEFGRNMDGFIREFVNVARRSGLRVSSSPMDVRWGNGRDVQGVERVLAGAAGSAERGRAQLIMVVLPNTEAILYGEVKRVGDTHLGVVTQCVVKSKVEAQLRKGPGGAQYFANVCLKINAKLGGVNTVLNHGSLDGLLPEGTIVFGADMTHPGPGDDSRPSIAALVASMDESITTFAATTRIQFPVGAPPRRQDAIEDMEGMVQELLKKYQTKNGELPKRFLFYRDGVSSGQFASVLDHELINIMVACELVQDKYTPNITFVTVQKRHSARFMPMRHGDGDRSGNVKAGTVVDQVVVHPYEFDFYLNSHAGLQGTSRPAHYHVLYDSYKFTADALQELTYRLCYLYARATRSVSVVPAVYYADLVCTRARHHFRDVDFSEASSGGSDMSQDEVRRRFGTVRREIADVMYYSKLFEFRETYQGYESPHDLYVPNLSVKTTLEECREVSKLFDEWND